MKKVWIFTVFLIITLCACACQGQVEKLGEAEVPAAGSAPAGPSASASGEPGPAVVRVECEQYLDLGKMLSWMYERQNGDVDITFSTGSVSDAARNIKAGDSAAALFGLDENELKEYGDMNPAFFFSDGVAIIVNSANNIEGLSTQQLEGILSGGITDWSEVGGAAGRITVYAGLSPFIGRQIERQFKITLGDMSADYASSGGDCGCAAVENEAGGISFASLAAVTGKDGVKALKIDGASPSRETVLSGQYPLKRGFYLMAGDDEQAAAFIDYCLNNPDAAAYLYDKGYIKP